MEPLAAMNNDSGESRNPTPEPQNQKDYIVQESDGKDYYVIIPNDNTNLKSKIIPMPPDLFLE
jgi:hypothetical protein